jgi:hypothetical protein
MPDRLVYQLLCLLLMIAAAMPVSAAGKTQAGPDEDAEDIEDIEEPEPPKQVMKIEVRNNLLDVELENVDFGTVIRSIADKAKFKVEGSGAVFGKKLNTKFSDIEIERGVARLLTLAKESNYMIQYDARGAISRLEILSLPPGASPAPGSRPSPVMQPPVRTQPMPVRPAPPSVVPPRPAQIPVRPAARPVQPQVFPDEDEDDDDDIEEIPYVSPQSRPRFSPNKE